MTVNDLCQRALQIAGRGDKPTTDDSNQAIVSLNALLAAWRPRGVDLFNLHDQQLTLPVADNVLASGSTYVCIRAHYSSSVDEPGVGANWENYWALTSNITATIAWAAGTTYLPPNRIFPMGSSPELVEVANARVVQQGIVYSVIPVGRGTFAALNPSILGIPKVMFQVPGNSLELLLHPTPDYGDMVLLFTGVMMAPDHYAGQDVYLPPAWIMALQYGVAAELGYHFGLSIERIDKLEKKADREFLLAVGSPKKEAETCRVRSLY